MEVKKTEKIDVTKYVGTKVLIVKAQFQESKHGETLFLQSEEIALKDGDTLPENSVLTANKFLSLMKDKEDGSIFIGKDTKLEKFLIAHKVDMTKIPDFEVDLTISEIEGIEVVVQKNGRGFLEIA